MAREPRPRLRIIIKAVDCQKDNKEPTNSTEELTTFLDILRYSATMFQGLLYQLDLSRIAFEKCFCCFTIFKSVKICRQICCTSAALPAVCVPSEREAPAAASLKGANSRFPADDGGCFLLRLPYRLRARSGGCVRFPRTASDVCSSV